MIRKLKNLIHFFLALASVVYYGFPARKLKVIGVTGTDGKTTTATMIYQIIKTAGRRVALISTVAAYVGDKQIDTGFHVTSPSPWALQKLLRDIVGKGCDYLVMEVTSHGLDQHRLLGSNISIGVVTNITHEHLDYHKTYENYVKAKAKVFKGVKYAVVNKADGSFEYLKKIVRPPLITYENKQVSKFVKEKFPEAYNRMNAQAAMSVARLIGITEEVIETGVNNFSGILGRMDEVENESGVRVIVDFAHTPNALKSVLAHIRKEAKNRVIAVFGAAGKRDYKKRPLMGKVAAKLADEVVLTAEDPRGESVENINVQIKFGAEENRGHLHSVIDRKKAIEFAILKLANKGDVVGVFGKGHEKSLNVDGVNELPWSDKEVALMAIKKRIGK